MMNEKGSRSTVRNVLTLKESLHLAKLVQDDYTNMALSDADYAELVEYGENKPFRFPMKAGHIKTTREALGIPSNTVRQHKPSLSDCSNLVARVTELELQLSRLGAFVRSKLS